MLKIIFDSFREIKKQRLKNPFSESNATPFAGAFLIAFIIINWELFYTIFNLESGLSLDEKIKCISNHLNEVTFTTGIERPLLWSFISIIFYYVFNNVSLVITTIFNSWVKPIILKVIDNSKIVTREVYNQLKDKLTQLSFSYEELNKTFSESRADLGKLKEQLNDKEEENSQLQDKLTQQSISYKELDRRFAELSVDLEKSKGQLINFTNMNENLKLERNRLEEKLELSLKPNSEILNFPLTPNNLEAYTRKKFPWLEVDRTLQSILLKQIQIKNYPTLRHIDDVVNRVKYAVVAYQLESPQWFTTGTDYISKALGFVDEDFRVVHGFTPETMSAFTKFGSLVNQTIIR
jgi:hypothetical protein